ncbi:glycosyltransferase [Specibacter sp. RAF43]|uniref:glycosyltransferase n=1 Tax=Specibacter sp. RAF43 TaxID=3233057 RepID=UPI003F958BF6
MAIDTAHFLLTRFNLPSTGPESLIRASPEWLLNRVELFRHYTIPSVLAQDAGDCAWIIYFDPESPDWLKSQIAADAAAGIYTPIFTESVDRAALLAELRTHAPGASRRLITTNLDNDDGLASDFIQRIQSSDPGSGRHAIYLADGLIKSGTEVFARTDKHNAFCSVAEDWDEAVTCWSEWHNLLADRMPAIVVRGAPAWLQVIHGANVSNRVRGTLASPAPHVARYAGLLDDVRTPARADLVMERLVRVPARATRETARAMGKFIVMKAAGKEGLDRLKLRLASRRRTA